MKLFGLTLIFWDTGLRTNQEKVNHKIIKTVLYGSNDKDFQSL